ncbi:MAG: alpha/beta hydrolase [Reichenbachiella sp.]
MKKVAAVFTDSLSNELEYCLYGDKNEYLIAFPGFGESYEVFETLAMELSNISVLSINPYFLGGSKRNAKGKYLKNDEWKITLGELLKYLKINRFSVLGFSLGGRFAISTFSSFENSMDHLILVAVDGIEKRFIYELATFPLGMQQLFFFLMKKPKLLFSLVKLCDSIGIMNSYNVKFVMSQLESEEARMSVFYSWISFKELRISRKKLAQRMSNSIVKGALIFGQKDKVVGVRNHHKFLSDVKNVEILNLPYGHYKLVENGLPEIQKILNKP